MNKEKEARDRKIIQLIQSQCVHRRQGVITVGRQVFDHLIFYCQDCEKILYGKEQK